jgi:hypothetical protein
LRLKREVLGNGKYDVGIGITAQQCGIAVYERDRIIENIDVLDGQVVAVTGFVIIAVEIICEHAELAVETIVAGGQ